MLSKEKKIKKWISIIQGNIDSSDLDDDNININVPNSFNMSPSWEGKQKYFYNNTC